MHARTEPCHRVIIRPMSSYVTERNTPIRLNWNKLNVNICWKFMRAFLSGKYVPGTLSRVEVGFGRPVVLAKLQTAGHFVNWQVVI